MTQVLANHGYLAVATNGAQLFVANLGGPIDVYNVPLTSASHPAFSITSGLATPVAIAFDHSGNLYVGNLGNSPDFHGSIAVYNAPFSSTATPSLVLTLADAVFGMTIGK